MLGNDGGVAVRGYPLPGFVFVHAQVSELPSLQVFGRDSQNVGELPRAVILEVRRYDAFADRSPSVPVFDMPAGARPVTCSASQAPFFSQFSPTIQA